MKDLYRAFDPRNPIVVATATLCAVLVLWDVYTVVTFSFDGGPWDSLDDPVITLSALNDFEARSMHDDFLQSIDLTSTAIDRSDFDYSAEEAKQNWNDLRDEGLEIGTIDDGIELDMRRDEAVAFFAPEAEVKPLPMLSRAALIIAYVGSLSAMLFSLGWLGVILWKKIRKSETRLACELSLPIAGSWYGVIVFLYASTAMNLVMFTTFFLPIPELFQSIVQSSALLLAIPIVTAVVCLLCVLPNKMYLLVAFGWSSRLGQMNIRGTLAMIVAVVGLEGIAFFILSRVLPESSQASVWWESLDENLMFGPATSAVLTSLDAVVGAPVVEEIIFRGLLFGAIFSRWGFWPAAIFSSLVFASVHGYELEGSISVITSGIFLCWLYRRTGRLWAPMVAHGLLNGVVVLQQFAIRELALSM